MSDMQAKIGHTLLKSLVNLREEKGKITLEDVGEIFESMAATLNPPASTADHFLHGEIAKLASYIEDAKDEIFAISTNDKAEQVISDASSHLDAVIKATEEATNTIMDAADTIQNHAAGVGGEKEKQIVDATVRIYDACTFQDISGQRITKVIKLLGSIEERINRLNSLFGTEGPTEGAAQDDAKVTTLKRPMTDKDLLNGPQLPTQSTSQDDIDALFASLGGKA